MSTLRTRMLVASTALALTSIATVSFLSWSSARSEIVKTRQERLGLFAASFAYNLTSTFDRAEAALQTLASDAAVASNADGLFEGFNSSGSERAIVAHSFTGAVPPEERIAIETTWTATLYGLRHKRLHDPIRRLLRQNPYADALLIDRGGRIAYTAWKGSDFGADLGDPAFAGTGLARLFAKLSDPSSDGIQFEDFAPYLDGTSSGFLGIPIQRRENVAMGTSQKSVRVGYLVLRLASPLIDQSLYPRAGLGRTGEIQVFGPDGIMRNGGHAKPDERPTAIAATMPVRIRDVQWTVLVRQEEADALGATWGLVVNLLLSGVLVSALAMFVALWATHSLIRPLSALTGALQRLARRELVGQIPGSDRKDEIGDIARAVVGIRDVTAEGARAEADLYRKLSEANHRLANLDPLTQLANRRGFLERLAQADANPAAPIAAMLLDLDGFKPINDAYGHAVGDQVLVAVAQRMRHVFGAHTPLARLGGDEFAVLIDGATEADASRAAATVIAEVAKDITIAGHAVRVGVSVGIATATTGGCQLEDLIEKADIALYAAKAAGKGASIVYEPALHGPFASRGVTGSLGSGLAERVGIAA